MRLTLSLPLVAAVGALFFSSGAVAQQFVPTTRIVDRIDETNLVALKGNTHPAANAKNDLGRVSDDLPMTDLILVLTRDAAQQAAFEQFVTSQYDPNSPNFHRWLTPDQVGANFGPSQTDIATVSNWLTGHGFTVSQVTKDHLSIRFSGTAGLVRSAFHTEIHNLQVRGVNHIGNMSDPQIPAALATVVAGVKSLHNFFPRPLHHVGKAAARDSGTGQWKRLANAQTASATSSRPQVGLAPQAGVAMPGTAPPQFSISVGGSAPYLEEDVAPYDFATIYNILPLWNGSTIAGTIDGTGQTIAVAGTSDIEVGQTGETGSDGNNDVATFRTFFGLPTGNPANTPIRISGNSQPLTVCSGTNTSLPYPAAPCDQDDLIENTLDVEWSGSVARNAQIILVASFPASASDDNLYDSESYIVDNVTARVMNVSYGECELYNGTAGNVEYYNLWQTAASEGIAVFVAAGDSGSASCDDGGDDGGSNLPYPAEYGLSVSGLASTPWNTAVGGTDFNWCSLVTASNTECTAAPYWASTNSANANAPESSALGYIPEVPWNDTCTSSLATAWMVQFWGGSPPYTYVNNNNANIQATDNETSCNMFAYYGQALSNAGDGDLLYLVDTIGGGGGASNCVVNASTSTTAAAVSTCTGTVVGTNSGSINLVNDGWPQPTWQTGVQGIPADGVRHIPDMAFFASDGFLSSSAYLICASDVTTCSYSEKTQPIFLEVGGTSVATPAMAGVMALINQKTGAAQGSPNAELYKLAATQTYASCSAERGSGQPVTTSSCLFNDIDTGTNAMACDYDAYVGIPSPNCSLQHSGDYIGILSGYSAGVGYDQATGLGSLNVANVVKAWPAVTGAGAATVTVTPGVMTLNANNTLSVTVTVASNPTGGVTPTGTVTLTAGTYTSAAEPLSNGGSYVFTVPANSLSPGANTLTAAFSGDGTYAAASGTGTVTVAKITPTVTVSPASSTIGPTLALTGTITVTSSGNLIPTGTVTLTSGTYSSGAQTLVSGSYSFNIPAGSLAVGTDTLTATYTPDSNSSANYNGASGSAPVAVTAATKATPTVTVTPSSSGINLLQPLTVTIAVNGGTGNPTPTGTVKLSSGSYTSAATVLVSGSAMIVIPAGSLPVGIGDTLAASYTPDANSSPTYNSATGSTTVTVTKQNATITVTPASSTLNSDASLGVTVTVAGVSGFTPTGTVSLSGGGYTSPTPTPSLVSGSVTFTIPANTLSAGMDTLTASYSGDSNYPSGSNTATVTVTESTFSLNQTPVAVTPATAGTTGIAPGASATATVVISPVAGYAGTITLTCQEKSNTATGGDGANCTGGGSTAAVTISANGTVTGSPVIFTVSTIAPVAELAYPKVHGDGGRWVGAGGGAVLALLVFLGIPARRRSWRQMLGVLVVMAALGSLTSCGGGSSGGGSSSPPPDPGTTAGTYTFTVQATGNPSVTPAVSTTFNVVVN